jgi:hypothetical protein
MVDERDVFCFPLSQKWSDQETSEFIQVHTGLVCAAKVTQGVRVTAHTLHRCAPSALDSGAQVSS